MKTANYDTLTGDERNLARMAARARLDTIYGGCLALTLAKRLAAMGSRLDYGSVISDVYSASTGRHSKTWEAWECTECGCSHLGQESAAQCCAENFDESDN